MKRILHGAVVAIVLPIFMLGQLFKYAGLQQTWPARIGVSIAMFPIVGFVTIMWLAAWIVVYEILKSGFHYWLAPS
jgi:uncharacterized protein with PQ loop repeat